VSIESEGRHLRAPPARRLGLALSLVMLTGLVLAIRLPSAAASVLTFQVNSTADAPDASPGDGLCADAIERCTLRAAVQEADAQPSGSSITILLPARRFPLTLGALLLTTNTVAIRAATQLPTVVDGRNADRVFDVSADATVTLDQLMIVNGNGGLGGGIRNAGTLSIRNGIVSNNVASVGGGIYNLDSGTLTLERSVVSGNKAGGNGGGIANAGGTLQVTLSRVVANKTTRAGGGIVNLFGSTSISRTTIAGNASAGPSSQGGAGIANGSGTLSVDRSTISGNTTNSTNGGSAILNILSASVSNTTINGNTAPDGSGALVNSDTMTLSYDTIASNSFAIVNAANLTATGTIIANSTEGDNCFGNPIQEPEGFNLDSGHSCGLALPTDLTNTDPMLAGLADNGGPTETQALRPGSPAIDHGGTSANGCPATDQRGVPRPQGAACDIGAFELVS